MPPHLVQGSEEHDLDFARHAHGGSPADGDAAAQRAAHPQPRRGLITGLWSSATRIASLIGLPALPAEGPGGTGDGAVAPHRRAAAALQNEALGAWIGWYRHRAAKRRVVQELTNLRGDMALRQHLTMWFEYCEQVSMTSPPPPPASVEHTPPTIKPWNPTLGVLAVATPPRVASRPPASKGASQGTAIPGPFALLSPEPRRDSPRLSPRKVAYVTPPQLSSACAQVDIIVASCCVQCVTASSLRVHCFAFRCAGEGHAAGCFRRASCSCQRGYHRHGFQFASVGLSTAFTEWKVVAVVAKCKRAMSSFARGRINKN